MKSKLDLPMGETAESSAALFFADRAKEITEFCVTHGAKVFEGWPVPTIWAYAFFHVVDRTAFLIREHGEIVALAFCQAVPEKDLRARDAAGLPAFNWRRSIDNADALALAEVIGRKELLSRLARQFDARFPGWRRKKMFTHRAGQLVELPPEVIERMLHEQ